MMAGVTRRFLCFPLKFLSVSFWVAFAAKSKARKRLGKTMTVQEIDGCYLTHANRQRGLQFCIMFPIRMINRERCQEKWIKQG